MKEELVRYICEQCGESVTLGIGNLFPISGWGMLVDKPEYDEIEYHFSSGACYDLWKMTHETEPNASMYRGKGFNPTGWTTI